MLARMLGWPQYRHHSWSQLIEPEESVAEKGIVQSDVVTNSEEALCKPIVGAGSNVVLFECFEKAQEHQTNETGAADS